MKCILTVIGKDKSGIIAKVSGLLAEYDVNIEDISQTIMQNTFTMIMLVNLEKSKIQLFELKQMSMLVGSPMIEHFGIMFCCFILSVINVMPSSLVSSSPVIARMIGLLLPFKTFRFASMQAKKLFMSIAPSPYNLPSLIVGIYGLVA